MEAQDIPVTYGIYHECPHCHRELCSGFSVKNEALSGSWKYTTESFWPLLAVCEGCSKPLYPEAHQIVVKLTERMDRIREGA